MRTHPDPDADVPFKKTADRDAADRHTSLFDSGAPDAVVCTALDCRTDAPLGRVTGPDGRRRVLCPDCAADFSARGDGQ
jgi:hypothetical protein